MTQEFNHIPVLLSQVCEQLAAKPGERYLDLTLGGAGHASAIAKMIGKTGLIAGFDRDPTALAAAQKRLKNSGPKCSFIGASFIDFDQKLREAGFLDRNEGGGFDIVLADLGLSSEQIDDPKRGFSHQVNAKLDMRMSQNGITAEEFLANVDETQLADILYHYGDIRQSRRLAKIITNAAHKGELKTTSELATLSCQVLGQPRHRQAHPATRVFQAIRIAVNDELNAVDTLLKHIPKWMKSNARLAIISFHSGEDRRVKQAFKKWQSPCICPTQLPQCICQKKNHWQAKLPKTHRGEPRRNHTKLTRKKCKNARFQIPINTNPKKQRKPSINLRLVTPFVRRTQTNLSPDPEVS